MMTSLYESLNKKYGNDVELRMFFNTEPFPNRTGNHNHFVLYVSDKRLYEQIESDIADFFVMDRVEVKRYDRYKGGLFYTAKNGLVNEDWDILGNKINPNPDESMLRAA